ncbi:hypothetical protein MFIFM68171_06571 [Madurella fahalii]|uniref:Uncharacterized protein n=1 Tax=Madurella fahalii TaxID=1157608 RepID=A0ABQ0GF30_9PEZI
MEFVIQPTAIPSKNYIAAMVTLNAVTGSLVTLRLGTNWSHYKKLFADDSFNSTPKDMEITFITSVGHNPTLRYVKFELLTGRLHS